MHLRLSTVYHGGTVKVQLKLKKNKTPSSFLPTRSQDASGFDDYMIMALDYVSASYLQKGNRFNEYNK